MSTNAQIQCIFQECEHHNFKYFPHTWCTIQVKENLTRVVNNTVFHFVDSDLVVEIFLKKKEHQKKGALRQKIGAALYTLYWGFKKIQFTLYTYIVAKILQTGAKVIQKLTPGFKNQMKNLGNFGQVVESPKR